MLKKKQNEIIRILLSQNTPITSAELGTLISVSVRSVKSYVNEINSYYHKKIILSSRNGYEINRQIPPALLITENDDIPQTGEERMFFTIKQLLLSHRSYLDLFELCDSLCISYSTVKSLITKMNQSFSSYNVEFICKNDCLFLRGSEREKRKLLSYIITEESRNNLLTLSRLKLCFQNIDVGRLYTLIIGCFRQNNFYLNDFAAMNLLFHILIIIDRKQSGNFLDSGTANCRTEHIYEEKLLDDLTFKIEESFGLELNKFEISEIYMLFKANTSYIIPESDEDLNKIAGTEALQLTEYYIQQISNLYLIDLRSESFSIPFSLHLKNLLFRLRSGHTSQNPMAESIRTSSPFIFDIATFITLDLMDRFHVTINEAETAFLAVHIGAEIESQEMDRSKIPAVLLCPNYHNMSMDLMNRLMLDFGGQLNIISCIHNEEAISEIKRSFRILFTTIPVVNQYDCTMITLSPLNLARQYSYIQDAINAEQDRHKINTLKANFSTFFEKQLFTSDSDLTNNEQTIGQLCEMLLKKGYVTPDFKSKVYRREQAATTAFGNIAIPHSINMDAEKTSIAVAVSHKGILWNNHTVYLVLLLAVNKVDKNVFRELYESLLSLFSEERILQEVRNCNSFEDFENLIYSNIQ